MSVSFHIQLEKLKILITKPVWVKEIGSTFSPFIVKILTQATIENLFMLELKSSNTTQYWDKYKTNKILRRYLNINMFILKLFNSEKLMIKISSPLQTIALKTIPRYYAPPVVFLEYISPVWNLFF